MKTATVRQPTFASLTQRIANQERRINEGVRSGSLTDPEAASLRERVKAAKAGIDADAFDGNGLTQGKAAQQLLNGLSKDIKSAKHNETMDVSKRVANFEKRVEQGTKDGTLTEAESTKLKSQIAGLKQELAQATTPEAKKAVQDKLKSVNKEIFRARHDSQFDANKRLENFEQRIKAGLADGTLNAKEAARLTGEVAGLKMLDGLGIKSAKLFNRVNRDVFAQRHDGQVDVAKRSASIGSRIDAAVTAGKLTQEQATAFKAELTKLSAEGVQGQGPRLNVLEQQIVSAVMTAPAPSTAA